MLHLSFSSWYICHLVPGLQVRVNATSSKPKDASAPGVSSSKLALKSSAGYRKALSVNKPRLWSRFTRGCRSIQHWGSMILGMSKRCRRSHTISVCLLHDAKNPCLHWCCPKSILCELAAAGSATQADAIWMSAFGLIPVVHSCSRSLPRPGGWTDPSGMYRCR